MAIDGLHASLIYLDKIRHCNTDSLDDRLQNIVRWEAIIDFRAETEHYWQSLVNVAQKEDLSGFDILLKSFPTSAHLYEAAIFTFRHTVGGLEPDNLRNIFALCSLSYIALLCSQRVGHPHIDDIFRDINIWRESIGDPQHRQLFNDLIQRLWGGCSGDITTFPFQTEQYLHSASSSGDQDYILPQSATVQDISLFGDFADPSWGGLLDVPGSLPAPNFQMPDATPGIHPTVLDNPNSQLGICANSAVMNILTSFIANCGDLMDILSGHGVTTKGPHSGVSLEVKNFTQALRRHDSFGGPSARVILAIVDRFVGLDYYQSIDEIRDYIAIVAKEILPSGKPFAEVCKSVYSSVHTDMAKIPLVGRRQHADRPLDRKLKKIPCHYCGEEFTRKTNMRRHITRKHANLI